MEQQTLVDVLDEDHLKHLGIELDEDQKTNIANNVSVYDGKVYLTDLVAFISNKLTTPQAYHFIHTADKPIQDAPPGIEDTPSTEKVRKEWEMIVTVAYLLANPKGFEIVGTPHINPSVYAQLLSKTFEKDPTTRRHWAAFREFYQEEVMANLPKLQALPVRESNQYKSPPNRVEREAPKE